eukprot:TRINITY_DN607_c1_g1_i1.p1 TRINITY_DN607_c1_g1~~TRINITY_DN607_c1_g1_i1.p1  ORF type:complete len:215 (-),score=21.69 TRINITY_DN607_c1_g1_i1:53-697(-)
MTNIWGYCMYLCMYVQYNVDTRDVGMRLLGSLNPLKGDFLEGIGSNPDLYGPFWVATTLIFAMAVTGNMASYFAFDGTGQSSGTEVKEWQYDFSQVTFATMLVYGYLFVFTLIKWMWLRYNEVPVTYMQMLCLYGYSMAVFIIASILCVIPSEVVQWIVVIAAFSMSAGFLLSNLHPVFSAHVPKQNVVLLGIVLVAHAGVTMLFKSVFFQHTE